MKIEPTPRGVLAAFFRQKYRFFLGFIVVAAGVTSYLYHAVPYYESHGSLVIRFGDAAGPDLTKDETKSGAVVSDAEQHSIIAGDINILQSHDLLLSLVNEFGVDKLYPGLSGKVGSVQNASEIAVGRLIKTDLIVKPDPLSTVVNLQVYNQDPKLAANFLTRLMDVFTLRQSQVYNDPQIEFLTEQVKRASDELNAQQQKLEEFKSQSKVTSLEGEITQLMEEKSDAKSAALQGISEAQTTLDELRARQADQFTTYRSDSFVLSKARNNLAVAEQQLQSRKADLKAATALDDPHAGSGTVMADAKEGGSLTAHIADINRRIADLESQRTQFNDITRAVGIAEMDYKNYQSHLEAAQVEQKMKQQNITSISVLDHPIVSEKPARPQKTLIVLLGFVAAVLLGLGTAIAAESLDDRFTNAEQVSTSLRLPVLASFGKARRAMR